MVDQPSLFPKPCAFDTPRILSIKTRVVALLVTQVLESRDTAPGTLHISDQRGNTSWFNHHVKVFGTIVNSASYLGILRYKAILVLVHSLVIIF